LLSAPEDVRLDLYMSAVRFLAAKGETFNWRDAAHFLLTQDAAKRDSLNRRMATAYYRHLKVSNAKE
jgi:CRISPR system Cascade subunit CasB